MSLDIIVPVLMGVALLWWIGRALSARSMLIAAAVTLAVIVCVLLVQNNVGR
jgi:low affinity Fe/Cu permease